MNSGNCTHEIMTLAILAANTKRLKTNKHKTKTKQNKKAHTKNPSLNWTIQKKKKKKKKKESFSWTIENACRFSG